MKYIAFVTENNLNVNILYLFYDLSLCIVSRSHHIFNKLFKSYLKHCIRYTIGAIFGVTACIFVRKHKMCSFVRGLEPRSSSIFVCSCTIWPTKSTQLLVSKDSQLYDQCPPKARKTFHPFNTIILLVLLFANTLA